MNEHLALICSAASSGVKMKEVVITTANIKLVIVAAGMRFSCCSSLNVEGTFLYECWPKVVKENDVTSNGPDSVQVHYHMCLTGSQLHLT